MFSQHMLLQRIVAGELFRAVWACILEFEVSLVDMPHDTFFLHLSKAPDPAAHGLYFVWTSYAVMGAQMFGKLGTLNKRTTNSLACHPTASIVVVLGEVRDLCKLTEHRRVLGFTQSISSFANPS